MKTYILLFALFIVSFSSSYGQSWQWGKRGGAIDATTSAGHQPDESVYSMATDPHGNLYVLSVVMPTSLNVDGHAITDFGDHDILITSFKCDGTYRWTKDLGSNTLDVPVSLKTDTLGGVYVAGYIPAYTINVNIDVDTSWYSTTWQFNFLAKFDTSGNYKWIRYPQPDTIGYYSATNSYVIDMDADEAGNSYSLWVLAPGAYAGGAYIVTAQGYYILKYDNAGNFISGTRLDISYVGYYDNLMMKRDHQLGRYYITGTLQYPVADTLFFGGVPILHQMYVGCFSSAGAFLWQRQDTDPIPYVSTFGRAEIDAQHNIYLAGRGSSTDAFNGYTITAGGSTGVPVAFKLDTNGTNIWAKNATVVGLTTCSQVVLNGNEVVIAGSYPGLLKWPGSPDSLSVAFGVGGYQLFITRFNAGTGAALGLDSLDGSSSPTSILADKFGNVYLGGKFGGSMHLPGDTLNSIGGDTDFFVAKYGTGNCDTVHIPALETPPGSTGNKGILKVYPNPATDELVIENAGLGTVIRLYNTMGQQVSTGTISSVRQTLSIENLVPGTYLLQLTDANGNRANKTIMKQ